MAETETSTKLMALLQDEDVQRRLANLMPFLVSTVVTLCVAMRSESSQVVPHLLLMGSEWVGFSVLLDLRYKREVLPRKLQNPN